MPAPQYSINSAQAEEHPELIQIWESAVKATHDFLKEEDFEFFKNLMPQFLNAVALKSLKDESGQILGFMGTADGNLEMLFVHANARGKGIGKMLLEHALQELKITKVDVNQNNAQAVGFYERFGFQTYKISELDGFGKPYPILHMNLAKHAL